MSQRNLLLFFVGALAACGAPPEVATSDGTGATGAAGASAERATPPDPTQVIERTIVRQRDDGTEEVTTSTVSVAQQQAELAAREQHLAARGSGAGGVARPELASVDSGCSGSSLWIFDSKNNSKGLFPFNHEICFYKSSAAPPVCTDLRPYTRYCELPPPGSTQPASCAHWASDTGNAIGSYYAGSDAGKFLRLNGAVDQGFAPYFRQNDAQVAVAQSTYVCFDN